MSKPTVLDDLTADGSPAAATPFAADPAFATLAGPTDLICRRAGTTLVDIAVILSIPLIACMGLASATNVVPSRDLAVETSSIGPVSPVPSIVTFVGSVASHACTGRTAQAADRPRNDAKDPTGPRLSPAQRSI